MPDLVTLTMTPADARVAIESIADDRRAKHDWERCLCGPM